MSEKKRICVTLTGFKRLALACLAATASFMSMANPAANCTVVFSASGGSYDTLQSQITLLSRHLRTKNVRLIDLNHWQTRWPYIPVSGREKAQMRRQFGFAQHGQHANAQAVLLNVDGEPIRRYSNTLDLVDMLMDCSAS